MDSLRETQSDGTLILDTPVTLPEVLDVLVVGGGPFGTAVAFRAKELGLSALVIDYDDLMKRIRDYAKDKLILPRLRRRRSDAVPQGRDHLVKDLVFDPIDKDDMCVACGKSSYERHKVPTRVGVELTGIERADGCWSVKGWDHQQRCERRSARTPRGAGDRTRRSPALRHPR